MEHGHQLDTFLGGGAWGGLDNSADPNTPPDLRIVGVPFQGGGVAEAARAPGNIRELSMRMKTIDPWGRPFQDLRLQDLGDVSTWRFDLSRSIKHIYDTYRGLFSASRSPILSLGGDHSITAPIVRAASEEEELGLLWIDAHPDLLDTYLGSRDSHGSPLRRILEESGVAAENVLLVGTRAFDPPEPEIIRDYGIAQILAMSIHEDPAAARQNFQDQVDEISARVGRWYVSIDLDALDPSCAPATGSPAAGGLSTGDLLWILRHLPDQLRGFDLVEYVPARDPGEVSATAILSILSTLLSHVAPSWSGKS